MRKHIYLFNNLVTIYNRSRAKLARLISQNKNARKQDILKRRISKLFSQLSGLNKAIRSGFASVALIAGCSFIPSNEAKAQLEFAPEVVNPFGLTATFFNTPSFTDLDSDGDFDLMVSDTTGGNLLYFKNSGTASVPAYDPVAINPFSLTPAPLPYVSSPAFADLDNDGDQDLMLGGNGGDLYYYQNTGTSTAPNFAAPVTNPFSLANIGTYLATPDFADLDNDGDFDMITGGYDAVVRYFPNTGTASSPSFDPAIPNPFGLVSTGVPPVITDVSFGDLDGDGDIDILSGGYYDAGNFYYFENSGTPTAPSFGPAVTNPFNLLPIPNLVNWPDMVDLDNDGDMDIMCGTYSGDFYYYEQVIFTSVNEITHSIHVSAFPNPATEKITIECSKSIADKISLCDATGKEIETFVPQASLVNINMQHYTPGVYMVRVLSKNETNIIKIIKK
ncbi:MAG TPA: T9SS type A sorting domain-containing protein [Flavobacteriales bacterium]|nr:T9SS type A sorting domain-containing protein [Flavobacteriales bacterium]